MVKCPVATITNSTPCPAGIANSGRLPIVTRNRSIRFFRMRFQHPQGFWIKSEKPGRGNGNDDDILSQSIAVKRYFLI
jgi:hypothetical protein